MVDFLKSFFKSNSKSVESEYTSGVSALQKGDYNSASKYFSIAAQSDHVSAIFNLSLLWGGGYVTPYDFDLAADCWYKAARAEHPRAKAELWQLEAADRGGYGAHNLAKIALDADWGDSLIPSIMICAARFYDVICRKFGATADVIAAELDLASNSEFDFVRPFIKRTGIENSFYAGGLRRLKSGSSADQITDGLNELSAAMLKSGVSNELVVMARCSIVGHIILKSPFGDKSEPLLGMDSFFSIPRDEYPTSIIEVEELMKRLGQSDTGKILKSGAHSGNVFCQVLMSQMGWSIPAENRTDKIQKDLEIYTEMAARSGDAGSQYNYAKIYMNKIKVVGNKMMLEDIENIKQAKYWYGMAADQGILEAKASLKRLEVFD